MLEQSLRIMLVFIVLICSNNMHKDKISYYFSFLFRMQLNFKWTFFLVAAAASSSFSACFGLNCCFSCSFVCENFLFCLPCVCCILRQCYSYTDRCIIKIQCEFCWPTKKMKKSNTGGNNVNIHCEGLKG